MYERYRLVRCIMEGRRGGGGWGGAPSSLLHSAVAAGRCWGGRWRRFWRRRRCPQCHKDMLHSVTLLFLGTRRTHIRNIKDYPMLASSRVCILHTCHLLVYAV